MNEVEQESNRQNPDWPIHPLPFGRGKHPDYPIRHGIPSMDRCICGGVRHWHAVAPYGCDDCPCEEFTLDENWRPPVDEIGSCPDYDYELGIYVHVKGCDCARRDNE